MLSKSNNRDSQKAQHTEHYPSKSPHTQRRRVGSEHTVSQTRNTNATVLLACASIQESGAVITTVSLTDAVEEF